MTSSALNRPHVLIVSDDGDLATFLTEGLMVAGFWTSTIASTLQALEVFRLRTFDIILVDAALEGLGAVEFLKRLRSAQRSTNQSLSNRPAIAIAATPQELSEAQALEAGADQIIYAPFEIDELALALFAIVGIWREVHPDELWADELAQQPAPE